MTHDSTNVEQNKALVRRFYEPFRTGDASVYVEILAPEWVNHPVEPGVAPGSAGAPPVGMYRQVLPDIDTTTDAMIGEGDLVAVRSTHRGTHSGELLGIPAAGKRIELRTQDMHRLADGRIVETWHLEDFAELYMDQHGQQLADTYLSMLNTHDPDLVDRFVAIEYRNHNGFVADGREGNRQFWAMFFAALPDLSATMEDPVIAGDRVVGRFTYRGTQTGELIGIPASGNAVEMRSIDI